MNPSASNFYALWRARRRSADALRDENGFPAERLLQAVWQHQRLRRGELKTLDGQPVRVLHPGFASAEGGPDFRDSLVQIGGAAPRSGDVEVDLRVNGWRAHGHDRNPNFRNVILHVVWEDAKPPANAPAVLSLQSALDAPLGELGLWLENQSASVLPENLRGRCSAPLRALDETRLADLLGQAARVRFEAKAAQFSARARRGGWEQALWEGLFRALGYKHNTWPMQSLAEARDRWAGDGKGSALEFQARLLGIGGLLPADLTRSQKGSDAYLRRVWDCWWRERDEFADCAVPRAAWNFHGLRPANHPQRRLALASHWLADRNWISKIERWCAADLADGALSDSLLEILQIERDEFWSWHWTWRSAQLKKPRPLLGAPRVTDLAVNVILPWLWTRAAEGKNARLQREIERRYLNWPAAEDNSVLKQARQRLLGTASRRMPRSAAAQQGLMQIVRDFCAHSNAICENCRLPAMTEAFRVANGV